MPHRKFKYSEDIQSASQLTIDGINGIIDIVESMYITISRLGGVLGKPKRAKGIAGVVFSLIRFFVRTTGFGLDRSLSKLHVFLREEHSSFAREAIISALNGVLGDYLFHKKNPLSISTQFRQKGFPVSVSSIREQVNVKKRLLIVVHGLCMNDLQWSTAKGHNHGEMLAQEMEATLVYLHYNTGRHISENGKDFSLLMEELSKVISQEVDIHLLVHSMGGLVSRSAFYQAGVTGSAWLVQVKKIVFLGTPHRGALLEKLGNGIDLILGATPYTAPFSRIGKIRSSGITDMRYSIIIESDWKGKDRFTEKYQPTFIQLPEKIKGYAVAAVQSTKGSYLNKAVIGDGLVTLQSALGKHSDPEKQLSFLPGNTFTVYGVNHIQLLSDLDVYEKVKSWLVSDLTKPNSEA